MSDLKFRSLVLQSNVHLVARQVSRFIYKKSKNIPLSDFDLDYYQVIDIERLFSQPEYLPVWLEAQKINRCYYSRVSRLKNRIRNMLLDGRCLFLTFTFSDEFLRKTSKLTRRRYVCRFCDRYGDYVGNIDYGAENGREHYHVLLRTNKTIKYNSWKCGNLDGKKVRFNPERETSSTKLAKYIAKLCNHAIKESTRQSRLIYSR